VTWIGGLARPRALLAALLQTAARKQGVPLDRLCLSAEVTKKASPDDVEAHAEADAAYVDGLYLHGARWDLAAGSLDEVAASGRAGVLASAGRPTHHRLPVLLLRPQHAPPSRAEPATYVLAAPPDPAHRELYVCPVYATRERGATCVLAAALRTRAPPAKWALAGVALLLGVAGADGEAL